MIPRLKGRGQFELNQNTEPKLNLTPHISLPGWKENCARFGFQPALLHPEPALHCPTSPTSLELLPVDGTGASELRGNSSPPALVMLGAGAGPPRACKSCTVSEMQILTAEKQTLKPSPGFAKIFSPMQGFPCAPP